VGCGSASETMTLLLQLKTLKSMHETKLKGKTVKVWNANQAMIDATSTLFTPLG